MGVRTKRLILSSIFCLAFALSAQAQDKPQIQLISPQNLLVFPSPLTPNVWGTVQGLDLLKGVPKHEPVKALDLRGFYIPQSGVCSVPLLEVHVEAVDPGMVLTPRSMAVAIPQARVPAPACQKK